MTEAAPPPQEASNAVQRAAIFGVLTTLATLAGSIARAKATAVVLGPTGLGEAASVLQITALVFVPIGLITGPALVSAFARAKSDPEASQAILDTASTVVVGLGVVLIVVATAAGWFVFPAASGALVGLTALAATAALLDPLVRIPGLGLLARGDVRRYAILNTGTWIVFSVAVVGATFAFGLSGQFLAAVAVPLVLVALFWPVWRAGLPDLRLAPLPRLDRAFLRDAIAVSVSSLIAALAIQGALSTIRWSLWREGGAEANGQFQAAWAIGGAYIGIVLQGLGTGIFPRYAAAKPEDLATEVDAGIRFVLDVAPPVILIAIAVREPVMRLLYSAEFQMASEMVGYQMAADLAKAVSYVYAGVLLYRGNMRAFLVTEVVVALLLGLIPMVLIPLIGPPGASYGYAITYSVYALLTSVVLARACDVPIRWRVQAFTLGFTVVASGLVAACLAWPMLRFVVLAVGLAWASQSALATTVVAKVRTLAGR